MPKLPVAATLAGAVRAAEPERRTDTAGVTPKPVVPSAQAGVVAGRTRWGVAAKVSPPAPPPAPYQRDSRHARVAVVVTHSSTAPAPTAATTAAAAAEAAETVHSRFLQLLTLPPAAAVGHQWLRPGKGARTRQRAWPPLPPLLLRSAAAARRCCRWAPGRPNPAMSDSGAADTTDGEAGAAVAGAAYPPDGDGHRGRLRSGCAGSYSKTSQN